MLKCEARHHPAPMVVANGLYVLYNDLRPWKRMMCSIVYEYISCWQAVVVMYWLIIRSLLLYCKHFSAFLVTIAYAIRSSSKLECDTTYILHHFANGWRITSCTWAIWLGAKSTLHSGRLSVVYHYSLSLGVLCITNQAYSPMKKVHDATFE